MDFNIVDSFLGFTLFGAEWVLWLLLFLSVLSLAVILDRILYLRKLKCDFSSFSQELSDFLSQKKWEGAAQLCDSASSLESQTAAVGLKLQGQSSEFIQAQMESTIVQERQRMERGLVILGTLGNNAPFIGLFGTVLGIIKAFHDLSLNPEGGSSVVMAGVSEALVATAVGILVAIPAVIAFNFLNRNIRGHIANAQTLVKTVGVAVKGKSS